MPEVLHVGADRRGDARVLHLDGDRRGRRAASRGTPARSRRPRSAPRRTRAKTSSSGSSSSSSITLRISLKVTVGAASRSAASLRWNSSRCSSGTSPTSRNDITWPTFIAAPFIVPSAATICSAASIWRRSSAASLRLPRLRVDVRGAGARLPHAWPAASPPILPCAPRARWGSVLSPLAGSGSPPSCCTCDPGTMSSPPSGQRTHALAPPS